MKGEVKKLRAKPLILDEEFVKDGLEAVSTLTGKEPYYIVGGVATQSYLPTLCRRATSDIDLSIVKPLNNHEFKEISKPVSEYLSDHGYSVATHARSRAFNLEVEDKEGGILLIEFVRRNKQSFEKSRKKLERELDHSKRKIVEARDSTYAVCAPEDIMVPKLARSLNAMVRDPILKTELPREDIILSDESIRERLYKINGIRERAMSNPSNLSLFDYLKFISDLFDIRILSEIGGVNIDYFHECISDWRVLQENSSEKHLLYRYLLPSLNEH